MKNFLSLVVCIALIVSILGGCGSGEQVQDTSPTTSEWIPDRPIQFIVPYAAGGAIDRVTRALQPHLQEYLGVPVTVVNMPGGSTVIAYEHVFNSEKDGYTILSLSPEVGTMAVMGNAELTPKNWVGIGFTAAFANTFVVNKDSQYNDLNDLIDAMKKEKLTAACAANGGAWSQGVMLMAEITGANDPEFVPQGGGFVAAQAAMKNEVDFATCGLGEVVDLLAGGELRSLGYYGLEPFHIEGYGDVPVISEFVPEAAKFSPFGGWTGFAVPEGTPDNIVEKLVEAYKYAAQQDDYKAFLQENAFSGGVLSADNFQDYVNNMASVSAWMLYNKGFAEISPEEFGISKP